MSKDLHQYHTTLRWTGNTGVGTKNYQSYERSYEWQAEGKPVMEGSSDPKFRGDRVKYNPEEMLLSALSSCHMLWYLHLCAENNITVLEYRDEATGLMENESRQARSDGQSPIRAGHFVRVILSPLIKLSSEQDKAMAERLHDHAHERCFIANSVNFTVETQPRFEFAE